MSRQRVDKAWYTLDESIDRLASRYSFFGTTDLLQLVIEGRATLSVVFSDRVRAEVFKRVSEQDLSYEELPCLSGEGSVKVPVGGAVVHDRHRQPYQATGMEVELVEGDSFALAMIGGEVQDVHDELWRFHRKPREETLNIDGTFCQCEMEDGRALLRLLAPLKEDSDRHYPMGRLPKVAMFVMAHADVEFLLRDGESEKAAEDPKPSATDKVGGWPWGRHHTELLGHLDAAARKWWVNYDPTDITTAPRNEDVASWLRQRGVSARNAQMIATMLRADGLPTGPRTSP